MVRELGDTSFIVYERDDEWSIGIDALAEITVSARLMELDFGGEKRQWPYTDFARTLEQILSSLPIMGWRLYGTADFELSHLFYSLPVDESERPLLRLIIPRCEVRLRRGQAVLRTSDIENPAAWEQRIAALDSELIALDVHAADHVPVEIRQVQCADYKQQVFAAVSQIHAHEYDKVILSRTIPVSASVDIISSYLSGRKTNQPARSFLLQLRNFRSAGFCPETVVEVSGEGDVSTQPLAGTRASGTDPAMEERLRAELLSDPKEIAEHAISVRLAFDELEQICQAQTVRVDEFMQVCRRGTVQHLGSRVRGQLDSGKNCWDAFKALFPAVTASGIPKRPAIEAIARHEQNRRGLYSGCVLIADHDGMLDAALVLRSIFQEGNETWLRAGAGIVAMSLPERELEETCEKLSSVSTCLFSPRRSV
nr:salicylate synthase [Affinibrenneria salicis]